MTTKTCAVHYVGLEHTKTRYQRRQFFLECQESSWISSSGTGNPHDRGGENDRRDVHGVGAADYLDMSDAPKVRVARRNDDVSGPRIVPYDAVQDQTLKRTNVCEYAQKA